MTERNLDLRKALRDQANGFMRRMSDRLTRGQGVGGKPLPPKERPDGRSLGGSIGRLLRSGQVHVTEDGWSISYKRDPSVGHFHRGNPGHSQVRRPIVGLTREEREKFYVDLRAEIIRQLNAGTT